MMIPDRLFTSYLLYTDTINREYEKSLLAPNSDIGTVIKINE